MQANKKATELISKYPEIGHKTKLAGVLVKTTGNFQIFYEERTNCCLILLVWDTRRNPDELDKYL